MNAEELDEAVQDQHGRVVTSNKSLESDGDGLYDAKMFMMAAFPPIVGHTVITNMYQYTCKSVYRDVDKSEMPDVVAKLVVNGLKLLVGSGPNDTYPIGVTDRTMMARASEVHMKGGYL